MKVDYETVPLARLNEIASLWQEEERLSQSMGYICHDAQELRKRREKIALAKRKMLDKLEREVILPLLTKGETP